MNTAFTIIQSLNSDTKDIDYLTKKINEESSAYGSAYNFAFFIRIKDEIIAGCNGSVVYENIYTDQLWVDLNYRKLGLGKKLMEHVHNYGRGLNCKMATVSTLSFQNAYDFYVHLGYECEFERQGYAHNSSQFFLKKIL